MSLKFNVVTLFPELIETYCSSSIIGRGIKSGALSLTCANPRDFCKDNYRKVDDAPYGGGAGMVLKPEPYFAAFASLSRPNSSPVVLMCPQGQPLKQKLAAELATEETITILCGHYEGFDDRIRSLATHEISIGDYVLTSGELSALVLIDSVGRLVPSVVGKSISLANESFNDGLLEGPQYTKPADFNGMKVPEILLSGNHARIEIWRRQQALARTYKNRPDLLAQVQLNATDQAFIDELKRKSKD